LVKKTRSDSLFTYDENKKLIRKDKVVLVLKKKWKYIDGLKLFQMKQKLKLGFYYDYYLYNDYKITEIVVINEEFSFSRNTK
jgi:hypothetical protein